MARASGQLIRPMRVLVSQDGEWLCARILEYNMVAQARSTEALFKELKRVVMAHVAASIEQKREPFKDVPRAPADVWQQFKQSKISLPVQRFEFRLKKRAFKVSPAELRVAVNS